MKETYLIEENEPFSNSKLWEYERSFFDDKGISAWESGVVPFYITSNPFIACSIAEVIIQYILDQISQGKLHKQEPVYIVEIGTGSGKFSFYCMKHIFQLQQAFHLEDIDIVYVMTDFTQSNIDFWDKQPQLSQYLEAGKLDFALFDLVSDRPVNLVKRQIELKPNPQSNPMVVMGNYLFDTIPNDIYRAKYDLLEEGTTKLTTEKNVDNLANGLDDIKISDIDIDIVYKQFSEDKIKNPAQLTILKEYVKKLKNASFLFPVGAFACIERLRQMSNDQFMLIATDKGYTHLEEIEGRKTPRVVSHDGCFSMMVNFHAMGRYFELNNGDSWHQQLREGIKTSVFLSSGKFSELTNTSKAIVDRIDNCGPRDFFHYHQLIKKTKDKCTPALIATHMSFCHWDPRIFNLLIREILAGIKSGDLFFISAMTQGIKKVVKNVFDMPGADECYFNIASFFHTIGKFSDALKYYRKVLEFRDKEYATLYNIGLCYSALGKEKKAFSYYKQAKKIKSEE